MWQLLSIPAFKWLLPSTFLIGSGIAIPIYPMTGEGTVSIELFMSLLGIMATALTGMAGIMHRYYVQRIADLEATVEKRDETITELRDTISEYGSLTPESIHVIEALLRKATSPESLMLSESSGELSELPFPYQQQKRVRRPPKRGRS